MKQLLSTCLCFFILLSMNAQNKIIDRAIFFGNPEISSGQLSPDGTQVSFMRAHEGIMNLWVKDFNADFASAKLLTTSSSPIMGYFWTADSKNIVYLNDKGGDENINVFTVDPKAAAAGLAPPSRNLTPLEEITASLYQVSKKNPDIIMLGLNDRDKAWHDLYQLKISTGELTKVLENDNRYVAYYFDWDEKLRMAARNDENGNSQLLRINEDGSSTELYSTNIKESAYIAGWTKDNASVYLVSNKGDINLSTCYTMDVATGKTAVYENDPKGKVDFGSLWINDNTREIVSTSYRYDKRVRYFKDKNMEKSYDFLKSEFPDKEVGFTSFTSDYSKMLIVTTGDQYASDVYCYDIKTKKLFHQYTARPELKAIESSLSTMTPISYKSSDGLEIPGYLSLPKGVEAKNLPTVVLVHGGPKGPRDNWGYNSYAQFLTNRGYAVLQPNFRASGGYGKAFLNAGDKQWGKLMQDDITWGVKHLVSEGISDAKRVAIMGGSYGGYATLAGLAFTPDVYACGIDIVGPSNLFTLLESIPPYWEAGRKWLYEMVGDPDTEEGTKLLREASPLFHVDQITKPLLIVQGANDPRVKKAEADQIAIALRDKGHEVDYLLAMDEGHGFRKPLNRMAMFSQVEKFLAKHIGGQYQKDIPDDVAETLKNLTVDISTVTYEPAKAMAVLKSYPEIKSGWKEGDYSYDVDFEVQGQKMPMTMTRKVKKVDGGWEIFEESNSAMGASKDMGKFTEQLQSTARDMEQGGQKFNFQYSENKVVMNMMGKEIPVEVDGLMLSDGPGYDMLLSSFGMKKGDELSYFLVDMMTGKAKQVVAKHEGVETIDGKELSLIVVTAIENANDVTKMWMAKNGSGAVKISAVLPAMGNAKMTIVRK